MMISLEELLVDLKLWRDYYWRMSLWCKDNRYRDAFETYELTSFIFNRIIRVIEGQDPDLIRPDVPDRYKEYDYGEFPNKKSDE